MTTATIPKPIFAEWTPTIFFCVNLVFESVSVKYVDENGAAVSLDSTGTNPTTLSTSGTPALKVALDDAIYEAGTYKYTVTGLTTDVAETSDQELAESVNEDVTAVFWATLSVQEWLAVKFFEYEATLLDKSENSQSPDLFQEWLNSVTDAYRYAKNMT